MLAPVAIVMEGWQVSVCWEGLRMFSGQLTWGTKCSRIDGVATYLGAIWLEERRGGGGGGVSSR